jgi:hypothetical protein
MNGASRARSKRGTHLHLLAHSLRTRSSNMYRSEFDAHPEYAQAESLRHGTSRLEQPSTEYESEHVYNIRRCKISTLRRG